jgi:outer membrane protein assembly factor BamB
VYGALASNWPVAAGVLVDRGVAYAACGIANFDGTHVYALDAATGKLRWQNNRSGCLDAQQNTGVSVQGHLLLNGGRLYLAGGNMVSPAVYDIRDGKFVGKQNPESWRGKELFLTSAGEVKVSGHLLYAPDDDTEVGARRMPFGAYASPVLCVLEQRTPQWNSPVDLVARPNPGASVPTGRDEPLWKKQVAAANLEAIAVAKDSVVVLWSQPGGPGQPTKGSVEAMDLRTGKSLWQHALNCRPVDWGLAIDRDGQVLVSLRDGRVLCFGPEK